MPWDAKEDLETLQPYNNTTLQPSMQPQIPGIVEPLNHPILEPSNLANLKPSNLGNVQPWNPETLEPSSQATFGFPFGSFRGHANLALKAMNLQPLDCWIVGLLVTIGLGLLEP